MTDARQPWQRGVAILTAIYITRMLGLFMIFPVFSLYANELAGANKTLVGIALGIYGLSQGLLQIPCGWLSDRYGRKPVIAGGLALFTAGSLLAACASNIEMMIVARAVQGMGAIAAVALAYATDITPPDKLGKTMTILGASIGIAFVLSLILGPLLAGWVGVAGLFLIIALMAAAALVAGLRLPDVTNTSANPSTKPPPPSSPCTPSSPPPSSSCRRSSSPTASTKPTTGGSTSPPTSSRCSPCARKTARTRSPSA